MIFQKTSLSGVWLIQLEIREDERGFFARTYCEKDFAERGLNIHWPQSNLTLTRKRGMLRGMHFQAEPHPEVKLLHCAAGAVYDVLVDVRPESPTFGKWEGFSLDSRTRRSLYVPHGIAHGFQCLEDNSEVFYQMSEFYFPELARGIRWDDPDVRIIWPIANPIMSKRDSQLPFLEQVKGS